MATQLPKGPNFTVGAKQLFLPRANIALLRTNLGTSYAKFRVPLYFSKLDLRDYLYHAYGVAIRSVRSYVKQQRVEQGQSRNPRPAVRRWHRPRAQKVMTVELVQPFEWPPEPETYKPWDIETVQDGEKEMETYQKARGSLADAQENKERRERMREQAKALLEGKKEWKPATGRPVVGLMPAR